MIKTNGYEQSAIDSRRRYVEAFNTTLLNIWRERILLLGAYRTGALLSSLAATTPRMDGKVSEVALSQNFLAYGVYVDAGVGKEVPVGNPGDIGREKKRKRKQWFSKKYYASVMNLKEFWAKSLGDEFKGIICDALDSSKLRKQLRNK